MNLPAARSGGVAAPGQVVGDVQLRQHSEHFAGPHLLRDLLFKPEHLQIEIVFHGETDAFVERKNALRVNIVISRTLEMLHRIGHALFLIVIERFAPGQKH